jgi:hypothetical protein
MLLKFTTSSTIIKYINDSLYLFALGIESGFFVKQRILEKQRTFLYIYKLKLIAKKWNSKKSFLNFLII